MEFATRETVERITRRKTRPAQARHLARLGLRYTLDADGWPVVPVRALERVYGVVPARNEAEFAVDLGALEALGLG